MSFSLGLACQKRANSAIYLIPKASNAMQRYKSLAFLKGLLGGKNDPDPYVLLPYKMYENHQNSLILIFKYLNRYSYKKEGLLK